MLKPPVLSVRPTASLPRPVPGDEPAPAREPAAVSPIVSVTFRDLPEDMRCWLQSRSLPRLTEPRSAHWGN